VAHFDMQIISAIFRGEKIIAGFGKYIAVSGQWGFLIKLPDLLCLDLSEKVIIFITFPRKRLLGQMISLGFKLGERTLKNRFLIAMAKPAAQFQ
jgi:hypothetical protein